MTFDRLSRRDFLASAAATAMVGSAHAQAEQPVRWSAGTAKPATKAPPKATDCHFHTYDAKYPVAPGATLTPPDASVEDYRALQKRIGTTRGVLVTPSTYGTDNSLQLASLEALGRDNFRVVAVVGEDVSDAELKRLDALGVRGVRFNLPFPGPLSIASLEKLSPRFAALGWHCQINMKPEQLAAAEGMLMKLPSRLVFDHLGAVPQPEGINSATYATIRRLLDKGNTYVKLSGAYLNSKALGYTDAAALSAAYLRAAPERMVWGSDWPHPTRPADKKPDDAELFDLLARATPDAGVLQKVLVDNPAELYGFSR